MPDLTRSEMMPNELPRFRQERDRAKTDGRKQYNGFLDRAAEEVALPEISIDDLSRVEPVRERDLPHY